jgi:hypothetical protein
MGYKISDDSTADLFTLHSKTIIGKCYKRLGLSKLLFQGNLPTSRGWEHGRIGDKEPPPVKCIAIIRLAYLNYTGNHKY